MKFSEIMGKALPFINSSFANSMAKSIYYIIPLSIAIIRGVSYSTDIFLFSFELYIFLMFTTYQSIEYMTTTYLSDEHNLYDSLFLGGILLFGPILGMIIYIVYFALLIIVLPYITYYSADELKTVYFNLSLFFVPFLLVPLSAIMAGLFNSRKLFHFTSLGSASGLAVFIILITLLKFNIGVLFIIAIAISEMIKLLVFLITANKKIIRISFRLSYSKEYWTKTAYYWSSTLIGALFPPYLSILASHFETGTVSVLSYALKISYMVTGIFNGAMAVFLVEWSKLIISEFELIKKRINRDLRLCFFTGAVTTILFYLLWPYIFPLIFKNIGSPHESLFSFFVNLQFVSMPFYIVQLALLRFFIATKTTRILSAFAAIRLIFVIGTSLLFTSWFQAKGIPLSICFTEIVLTGLFFTTYLSYSKTATSIDRIKFL